MRLKITLRPYSHKFSIPVNYNYPLSSAIYRVFSQGSAEFSEWLHDRGYVTPEGRPMKLFTFSRLFIDRARLKGGTLTGEDNVTLYFASPVEDALIETFVNGLLNMRNIYIGNHSVGTEFTVSEVSVLPRPEFGSSAYFKMLSPVTVSTVKDIGGVRKIYYYRPGDEGVESALSNNLHKKFSLIHNKEYEGSLKLTLDREYIRRAGGSRKLSKLITLKEGQPDEIKVKGFVSPFTIEASPAMLRTAYDSGLGERTSQGFGFFEKWN